MEIVGDAIGRAARLTRWEGREPNTGAGRRAVDEWDVYERWVAHEAPGPPEPAGPHRHLAAQILAYRVFPERLIAGVLRRAPVEVGDVVGIRFHLAGPLLGLFFAARVIDRFDGPAGDFWRTGFTYRTLRGHPELGEETFSVEKSLGTGRVRVALRAWSRPGLVSTWLAYPLARALQRSASRAALDNLERAARAGPAGGAGARLAV